MEETFPGIKGCTLGDVDIALPAEYRHYNTSRLPSHHKEWMYDVVRLQ